MKEPKSRYEPGERPPDCLSVGMAHQLISPPLTPLANGGRCVICFSQVITGTKKGAA